MTLLKTRYNQTFTLTTTTTSTITDCPNVTFMIDHECSGIPQDDKLIIQFKHSQNAYSRNKYTQKENFIFDDKQVGVCILVYK